MRAPDLAMRDADLARLTVFLFGDHGWVRGQLEFAYLRLALRREQPLLEEFGLPDLEMLVWRH